MADVPGVTSPDEGVDLNDLMAATDELGRRVIREAVQSVLNARLQEQNDRLRRDLAAALNAQHDTAAR